jgi:hypothetical protein
MSDEPGGEARSLSMNVIYKELATEHKELMSLVAKVEAFTSAAGIQPLLERLHELLIRHFSREQFPNGLYERMGAYGPQWHSQLRGLIRDHCVILSGIRAISERANQPGADEDPTFIGDLAEVIAHLRRHEQEEHELAEKLMALGAPALHRERA